MTNSPSDSVREDELQHQLRVDLECALIDALPMNPGEASTVVTTILPIIFGPLVDKALAWDLLATKNKQLAEANAAFSSERAAYLKSYELGSKWRARAEAAESERDALREALADISEFSSEEGTTLGALRRLADIRARAMAAIRTRTEGGENGR